MSFPISHYIFSMLDSGFWWISVNKFNWFGLCCAMAAYRRCRLQQPGLGDHRQTEQQCLIHWQKRVNFIKGVSAWAYNLCTSSHGHAWTLQSKLWSVGKFALKHMWPTEKCTSLTRVSKLTRPHWKKLRKWARVSTSVSIVYYVYWDD